MSDISAPNCAEAPRPRLDRRPALTRCRFRGSSTELPGETWVHIDADRQRETLGRWADSAGGSCIRIPVIEIGRRAHYARKWGVHSANAWYRAVCALDIGVAP